MKKIAVRCWKIRAYHNKNTSPDVLYITYPEDNNGHELITCLTCGAIYAVTVIKKIYVGPDLEEKLKKINCTHCGKSFINNYAYYPETYVINGKKYLFTREEEIPLDEEAIIKKFESIYG